MSDPRLRRVPEPVEPDIDLDAHEDLDPDALDDNVLRLVRDAAVLLRASEPDATANLETVVARVRREAAMTAVVKAFGGATARVLRSGPDLLGLHDDL